MVSREWEVQHAARMVFFTLTIDAPESVAGDYDATPAAFGPTHYEGVKRLTMADCGDEKTLSRREMHSRMALVRQTDLYSDYEMCYTQEKNYAQAVLLIKNTQEAPHAMQLPPGMKDRINIP